MAVGVNQKGTIYDQKSVKGNKDFYSIRPAYMFIKQCTTDTMMQSSLAAWLAWEH